MFMDASVLAAATVASAIRCSDSSARISRRSEGCVRAAPLRLVTSERRWTPPFQAEPNVIVTSRGAMGEARRLAKRVRRGFPQLVRQRAHLVADQHRMIDPRCGERLGQRRMIIGAVLAQFLHRPEHRDPPRRRGRAELGERGAHRGGVSIVAFVDKQRGAAGNCAWGSFQRPSNPVIRDLSERVIIASKGRFDRAISAKDRAKLGLPSVGSMTRDEFMEATVDVWEIPPERASRVGHPAPFPVALPERLIHMNTYVGDLVLDPFIGSGTTAVAAARTGRSYIGYDTDPEYVDAARRRVAEEGVEQDRSIVGLLANDGRKTEPLRGGWSSKEIAKWLLTEAGYTDIDDQAIVMASVAPTLRASDVNGRTWWFEVVGGRTSNRPGAVRLDLLWRAVSKGAVVREVDPTAGFVILTVDEPTAASGGRALAAVTGADKPITAVVDMLSDAAVSMLTELGNLPSPRR